MSDDARPPADGDGTPSPYGAEPEEDETFWSDRTDEGDDPPFWTGFSGDDPQHGFAADSPEEQPTESITLDTPTDDIALGGQTEHTALDTPTDDIALDAPTEYIERPPTEPMPVVPAPVVPPPLPTVEELTFTPRSRATSADEPPLAEPPAPAPLPPSEPRPFRPITLSKRRAATLATFAEALLPRGGDIAASASDARAPERFDAALGTWDPRARRAVERALAVLEWGSVFSRALRPFSRLAPADALAALERAAASRALARRSTFEALKFYVGNQWAASPEVERALGFDYGCLTDEQMREAQPLEVLSYPQVSRSHTEDCDVVVIGSGAGGAVVAREMAELGLSVIVLEEGGSYSRRDFTGPPFERFQRFYREQGTTAAIGTPPIAVPLGMGVGGSTFVGWGTAMRPPARVLSAWERASGVEGIDAESMQTFFERVERVQRVKRTPDATLGRDTALFRRGVESLGLHGAPADRAIEGCRGCGVCAFGCPTDANLGTFLTYLPLAQRAGATIYAHTRAERILVQDGRARGVVASLLDPASRAPAAELTVRAKVVVVAAGAIHTPALLARNAIGNASGLLGRELRLHPSASVAAFFDERVRAWEGTPQSFVVTDWHDSEDVLITLTASPPSMGAGTLPGVGAAYKEMLAAYGHMATASVFVADRSSGRVLRKPRDGSAIVYRLDRDDAHRVVKGILRTAQIFLAAGARAVYTGIPGIELVRTRQQLDEVATEAVKPGRLRLIGFHPGGTARMGVDAARSVVGPYGEVHGVPGLFVADASVFPGSPSAAPMLTVMAFATRTADHVARHGARYF